MTDLRPSREEAWGNLTQAIEQSRRVLYEAFLLAPADPESARYLERLSWLGELAAELQTNPSLARLYPSFHHTVLDFVANPTGVTDGVAVVSVFPKASDMFDVSLRKRTGFVTEELLPPRTIRRKDVALTINEFVTSSKG